MVDNDLCFRSAVDLAKDIREKTLSPVEVIQNALLRIEEILGSKAKYSSIDRIKY